VNEQQRLPLLSISDVAERLNVQVRHVRRLVAERRIPYIKWGHLIRFEAEEIERWLDASRRPEAG
jgi:excisionase family DNA binding protein